METGKGRGDGVSKRNFFQEGSRKKRGSIQRIRRQQRILGGRPYRKSPSDEKTIRLSTKKKGNKRKLELGKWKRAETLEIRHRNRKQKKEKQSDLVTEVTMSRVEVEYFCDR